MAETKTGHPGAEGKLRDQLKNSAHQAALAAVIRHSELRGDDAVRVARHAVTAATPMIRSECTRELGGITNPQATTMGVLALAGFALDVSLLAAAAARGGRTTRMVAGLAVAAHVGLVAYGRIFQRRIREEARTRLAGAAR